MGSPVSLRDDFDATALRLLARRTRAASQGRRLPALLRDGDDDAVIDPAKPEFRVAAAFLAVAEQRVPSRNFVRNRILKT